MIKLKCIFFLMVAFNNSISYGQSVVIDTSKREIVIKDSVKVGILITSSGNTLNLTQNYGQIDKSNKKYDKIIDKNEKFIFKTDTTFFKWECPDNSSRIKSEINFYLKNDKQVDLFSRIILQLEEGEGNSGLFKYREFFSPQIGENLMTISLRDIKSPFKITCGLILNEDDHKKLIKVYTQSCYDAR